MNRFELDDISQVSQVKRYLQNLAQSLGFTESTIGQASIIISEMGTNLVKFAKNGEILIHDISRGERAGIEIISIDKGPGIENINICLRDGYSTGGSPGTGLGAILRLSRESDYYSLPGKGTIVVSRIFEDPIPSLHDPFRTAVVSIPLSGEVVNGDGWSKNHTADTSRFLLVDGLGHGLYAHEATQEAIASFTMNPHGSIEECMTRIHQALRSTRGAAASLLEIMHESGDIHYVGIGNVSAAIVTPGTCHNLVSLPGTLGAETRKITSFTYNSRIESDPATHVIMTTDGISTKWDLSSYPGIFFKDPAIIASVIYRDFHRKNDDCSVLVITKNPEV